MLLMQGVLMNTQKNEQLWFVQGEQGYQLCKYDEASFKMMCDVEYANNEQALVSLSNFRLPEIVQTKTKLQVVLE